MNKDQVTGKIDQAVGKVEQSVGKSVGSQKLANKGVVKQAEGAVQETWGRCQGRCETDPRIAQGSRVREGRRETGEHYSVRG